MYELTRPRRSSRREIYSQGGFICVHDVCKWINCFYNHLNLLNEYIRVQFLGSDVCQIPIVQKYIAIRCWHCKIIEITRIIIMVWKLGPELYLYQNCVAKCKIYMQLNFILNSPLTILTVLSCLWMSLFAINPSSCLKYRTPQTNFCNSNM